ncbi:GntR family transcriptional regulator [Streptomyces sp. NPDC048111]|uniref:GntR family transcriptional regulator n=1 Tax=Streptomyces sp. NPDC048111 TaxID=3365500 RepID=UPI00372436DA
MYATKVAAELKLPVFVSNEVGDYRGVRLAWVEGWEDESHLFLVRFGEAPPERIIDRDRSDEEPFSLEGNRSRKRRGPVTVRPDQARFKLEVFRRYGPHCPLALAAFKVEGLIESVQGARWFVAGTGDRRPLVERVTDLLRGEGMKAGDCFPPEKELCERIGASRTAVRSAIAQMEGQGLIERWTRVPRSRLNPIATKTASGPLQGVMSSYVAIKVATKAHSLRVCTGHSAVTEPLAGPTGDA